jgi:uncharacterized protein YxeA
MKKTLITIIILLVAVGGTIWAIKRITGGCPGTCGVQVSQ